MKKIVFLTTLLLVLAGIIPLMAQDNSTPPTGTYAVTVTLERVYAYRKGYIVKYRKGISQTVDAYLPLEWFQGVAAKGDLIQLGSGTDWPHLTVFYKDGAFDHIRLYVRKEKSHETWGTVPLGLNLDDRFENLEDFKLEF